MECGGGLHGRWRQQRHARLASLSRMFFSIDPAFHYQLILLFGGPLERRTSHSYPAIQVPSTRPLTLPTACLPRSSEVWRQHRSPRANGTRSPSWTPKIRTKASWPNGTGKGRERIQAPLSHLHALTYYALALALPFITSCYQFAQSVFGWHFSLGL